jgi:hypothetical protein
MARPNLSDIHDMEKKIQQLKNSLQGISDERWRATLARDSEAALTARIRASEKTLENCGAIAYYLEFFSPPLSREITTRGESARVSFEKIKHKASERELQKWVKNELIPATKMSERLAHLAVSSLRKGQGQNLEFHRWSSPPK